ncbi:hypothetical protein TNCV_1157241 [Trichonephila clavipes]|nr:hypothetical protein TNCV_1157241 [Trichonephila clavipes]
MRTRCLKYGESHRTSDCPIKEKITDPICTNCNKTGHMANWSQCEGFPKIKQKKAALLGTPNKNKNPGTSATTEEAPKTNENNSNENYFGFNDAIIELRRFFLDYPFLLEIGRQFRNAKDEERIDIFYQNLINSFDRGMPHSLCNAAVWHIVRFDTSICSTSKLAQIHEIRHQYPLYCLTLLRKPKLIDCDGTLSDLHTNPLGESLD